MLDNDKRFVEEVFKKYYFENFKMIHVPEKTEQREFGYQKFDSGMIRHLTVKNDKELHLLLMQNVPSDVYCSNAYYSFPNLPMNEKDWKEADLIFDIDAKDLKLECRSQHTCTKCNQCQKISARLSACQSCNSTKTSQISLTCNNCVSMAKAEVKRLMTILQTDLGIQKENIHIYFSGNDGFHVYVYDSQYQKLGSKERAELSDYIMFRGTIPETFGMKKFKPERSSFSEIDESGWRGRVSKEIFGSKSKRSKIISEMIKDPNGYSSFQNQIQTLTNKIGVRIDPNVTMDIHRIFRLPGSLNSKSGLSKAFCKDLEEFNPYSDACFLDESSVEVLATCPISFKLKNKKFGPYDNQKVTMPKFAAVYMICKGLATSA